MCFSKTKSGDDHCSFCGADSCDQWFLENARDVFFQNFSTVPTLSLHPGTFDHCPRVLETLYKYSRFLSNDTKTEIFLTKESNNIVSKSKYIILLSKEKQPSSDSSILKRYSNNNSGPEIVVKLNKFY